MELQRLLAGRSIALSYGNIRRDRYGRRLAQVFLLPPEDETARAEMRAERNIVDAGPLAGNGGRIWLQAYLIAKGLARAYALPGVESCLPSLIKFESQAIDKGAGLWRNAAYEIRDARHAGELMRYKGTYQLVEGRVLQLGHGRRRIYLNFGRNWREDFTVGIDRKNLREFAAKGLRIEELRGRNIRARGWITSRNGPFILADDIGQIEVLGD